MREGPPTRRLVLLALLAGALAGCASGPDANAPVRTQAITIPGQWVFEPASAIVEAGEPVTFTNRGGADHTVTFASGELDATIPPGGSVTHAFAAPGTYAYGCKFHPPGMKGTITVIESANETAET